MNRPFRSFFLISLLFGPISQVVACPVHDCIRIGTWNIEWLGSEQRPQPSDANTIEAMATLIDTELSIDLIALEEINTRLSSPYKGKAHSLLPWTMLKSALYNRGYQLAEGTSGLAQQVVLAWRAPATAVQKPLELNVPDRYELYENCRTANLRKPLAANFRAGSFDFWAIGVHLKARGSDTKCSSKIRSIQIKALLEEVNVLQQKEPDIILLGDFNSNAQHSSLSGLMQAGFHSLHTKKSSFPDSGLTSYYGQHSGKASSSSIIDHVFIRGAYTKEWLASSAGLYQPKDPQQFAALYSDHRPVWADFSTKSDDD